MKRRYNFVEPKVIMAVTVSLMILAIGVFAFFVVVSETGKQGYAPSGTKTWSVSDPAYPLTLGGLSAKTTNVTNGIRHFDDGSTEVVASWTWDLSNPTQVVVNSGD